MLFSSPLFSYASYDHSGTTTEADTDDETAQSQSTLASQSTTSSLSSSPVKSSLQRTYGGYFTKKELQNPTSPIRSWRGPVPMEGAHVSMEPPEKRSEVSRMAPNVLLTDVWNGLDPAIWREYKVTHLLTVMAPEDIPSKARAQMATPIAVDYPTPTQLQIPLKDSPDVDLLSILPLAMSFIESALQERSDATILIHCFAGQSRSASCALAYLIDYGDLSIMKAYKILQRERFSRPNRGFMGQLRTWAKGRGERINLRMASYLPFAGEVSEVDEAPANDELEFFERSFSSEWEEGDSSWMWDQSVELETLDKVRDVY